MSQGIHREVGPCRWRGAWGLPFERYKVGVQSRTKRVVRIRSTKFEKGGKRAAQAGGRRDNLRGGAH